VQLEAQRLERQIDLKTELKQNELSTMQLDIYEKDLEIAELSSTA